MRILAWLGSVLIGLLLLAVGAAWLVPPMLDWAQYRGEIATLASRQVGRAVRIDGPVTLLLLPEPTLMASGVHIDESGDGARFAVQTLRLRVALGALLAGRVDARELVLRGLDVHIPWPVGTTPSGLRAPVWLSSVSARVENGSVSVGNAVPNGTRVLIRCRPLASRRSTWAPT